MNIYYNEYENMKGNFIMKSLNFWKLQRTNLHKFQSIIDFLLNSNAKNFTCHCIFSVRVRKPKNCAIDVEVLQCERHEAEHQHHRLKPNLWYTRNIWDGHVLRRSDGHQRWSIFCVPHSVMARQCMISALYWQYEMVTKVLFVTSSTWSVQVHYLI